MDVQELKKKSKHEIISLLEQIVSENKTLEETLNFENQKISAFSKFRISNSVPDFINEIITKIPIRKTSSVRIILSSTDFLGKPIIAGSGLDHEQYQYLDVQVGEQLGGKSILKIEDTSKIHNLIFDPKKRFPRSIYAIPIILSQSKVGFLWIADLQINAYTDEKLTQIRKIISEFEYALGFFAELLKQKQVEEFMMGVINSFSEPIILCDPMGKIILKNHDAINAFFLDEKSIELKQISTRVQEFIHQKNEKFEIASAGNVFEATLFDLDIPNGKDYYFYRFRNVTREKAVNNYYHTIINSLSTNFRNELDQINGYGSIISGLGELTAKQADYLQKISLSTKQLKTIIRDLLDINRIKDETFLSLSEVDIKEILKEVSQIFLPVMLQKKLDLEIHSGDDPISIISDREIFKQLLISLFESATQDAAMSSILEIDLEKTETRTILGIRNKGRGLSQPDIVSILEKKSSSGAEHTHLINAKKIIDLLLGKMEIESQLGGGKKVVISLEENIIGNKN